MPVVRCRHHLIRHFHAVGIEADGDALRPLAVLVVAVVPGLIAAHIHHRCWRRCGFISVGDDKAVHRIASDGRRVTGNRHLFDGIGDFFIIQVILRQIRKCVLPAVAFIKRQCLVLHRYAISIELNSDACWPLAGLVVIIFPPFFNRDIDCLRCIAVGDDEAICIAGVRWGVVQNRGFLNIVFDFTPTVIILRQTFKCVLPAVVFIQLQCLARHLYAISIELNSDACWPLAGLIVAVVPLLFNRDIDRLRCIAVGKAHRNDRIVLQTTGGSFAWRTCRRITAICHNGRTRLCTVCPLNIGFLNRIGCSSSNLQAAHCHILMIL